MLQSPQVGETVVFNPPENAYSPHCLQSQFAGQTGVLEGFNEVQGRVRFKVNGTLHRVNVNVTYLYYP